MNSKVLYLGLQALTYPPGSTDRMLYIAAFAVSGYASTAGRTNKPFNPLLGETYELVHTEKVLVPTPLTLMHVLSLLA